MHTQEKLLQQIEKESPLLPEKKKAVSAMDSPHRQALGSFNGNAYWPAARGLNGVMFVGNALVLVATTACVYTDPTSGTFSAQTTNCMLKLYFPAKAQPVLLNNPGVVSLSQIQLEGLYQSNKRRIAATVDGDNSIPTLTPMQEADDRKPSKKGVAAIIGGAAAALLVVVILVLVYICLMRVKKLMRQTSENASSVPSPHSVLQRARTSTYGGAQLPFGQNLRQLTKEELEHATSNFSQMNIIGEGTFGLVYKGLLIDGTIVAIKQRMHDPIPNFVQKVKQIASVDHRHLVKLIGYCEDRDEQLLVYDYISYGNVANYLYDSEGFPTGKFDMRQRLLIALGVAKGLEHLHGSIPPVLHMHFRSSNVLISENFTSKVSDYGLYNLVLEGHRAGSSSSIDYFIDPELNSSERFPEASDVYSFGVFLLELISGRAANAIYQSNTTHNLVLQAKGGCIFRDIMDPALGEQGASAAERLMELALLCTDTSVNRPSMAMVVRAIEQIQGSEIGLSQAELEDEISAVTLGSELFK